MTQDVEIGIRLARTGDAAGIAAVHVASWRETYAGLLPARALVGMSVPRETTAWTRTLAESHLRRPVFVAADSEQKIYGFASAGPTRDDTLDVDGEIYMLYVAPGFTGLGIGRELMRASFRLLARGACKSLLVWTLADNPSRFFYEAMGGRRVAERMHPFWGGSYREIAYAWDNLELPGGAASAAGARN